MPDNGDYKNLPSDVNKNLPSFFENNTMFDRQGIYARFALCYRAGSAVELANLLELNRKTVYQWASGERQVPWNRLKRLLDDQLLSWDWLKEEEGNPLRANGCMSARSTATELTNAFFHSSPACPRPTLHSSLASVRRWYRTGIAVSIRFPGKG